MDRKLFLACALACGLVGCDAMMSSSQPQSASGISKANVAITPGSDGLTTEQRNVRDRLQLDNKIGSIKHLYIMSAYSGQVLLYSTVKGKVTSSGKRLTPYQIGANRSADDWCSNGFNVNIANRQYCTNEVLQDDGTYGDSVPYIYWWDVQGRYHQQYVSGDMIVHISDQPIPVKSITLNLELQNSQSN